MSNAPDHQVRTVLPIRSSTTRRVGILAIVFAVIALACVLDAVMVYRGVSLFSGPVHVALLCMGVSTVTAAAAMLLVFVKRRLDERRNGEAPVEHGLTFGWALAEMFELVSIVACASLLALLPSGVVYAFFDGHVPPVQGAPLDAFVSLYLSTLAGAFIAIWLGWKAASRDEGQPA